MMPDYVSTNESLEAIVKGMDIQQADKILAVCGSGDQAFALLETAAYVRAVDKDLDQVEYAQERKKLLETPGKFRKEIVGDISWKYFTIRRIRAIKKKARHIEIATADIFKEIELNIFNKVYLSNATTYGITGIRTINLFLSRAAQKLRSPGLIYMSNAPTYDGGVIIPKRFVFDEKLTEIARQKEENDLSKWDTVVYRRAA